MTNQTRARRKPGHRMKAGKGRVTFASRQWLDYIEQEYEYSEDSPPVGARAGSAGSGGSLSSGDDAIGLTVSESRSVSSAETGEKLTRMRSSGSHLAVGPATPMLFQRCESSNSYAALGSQVGDAVDAPHTSQWVYIVDDAAALEAAFTETDELTYSEAVLRYAGARGRVRAVDPDGSAHIVFGNGKGLWFPPDALRCATKKHGGMKLGPDPATQGWVHFHLLRHGESTWNTLGRIQGQRDTLLSTRGRAQALQARAYFGKSPAGVLRGAPLDAVLVSPLKRAVDTAQAALLDADPTLPVCHDERLMEIDVGDYEARSTSDADVREFLRSMDVDTPFPNGESREDVAYRVKQCLLDTTFLGSNVAVVTHGGVIKALVHDIEGTTAYLPPVGNCSITTVSYHPVHKEWDVSYHNAVTAGGAGRSL
eukprot:TRINITY_DN1182_c0_g1_i1.p1 TRINITY_DN1182_c0_g1~~TRINITY_DN1182_c0_g1_i1.p1  ORF type:complete len:424 (+),score=100.82 TRINITY_DN1182_c0_g1_i1:51-1322(+)